MKTLKLYNWYGKEFDSILPEQSLNLKAYKKQVNNIYQRTKDANTQTKKIDKDLFLRSRTKLQDTLKRELSSHRVAYHNKMLVLKDSIKKLSYSDTTIKLINYELKKLKSEKSKLWFYLKDFEKSLKNTSDSKEVKINSLKNLIEKSKKDEILIMQKFAIFSVIKKYKTHHKDNEFKIIKIQNYLSEFEKKYLEENKNIKDSISNFYFSLEKKRHQIQQSKKDLQLKYQETKFLQKELYHRQKKNLILDFKKRILNIEYEYNQKSSLREKEALLKKQLMFKKIQEQKEIINANKIENENKVNSIVSNSRKKEKECNVAFNNYFKYAKTNGLFNLYISYIKKLSQVTKNDLTSSEEFSRKNFELLFKNEINISPEDYAKNLEELKKSILQYEEKPELKNEVNILKKIYFGKFNKFNYWKISKLFINSIKFKELSNIQKKYTHEAKFSMQKHFIFLEKANELDKLYQTFNAEKADALLELLFHKNEKTFEKEKEFFRKSKKSISRDFALLKKELKNKIKSKEITKHAYKNRKFEIKIDKKERKFDLKLSSEIGKNKEIIKTLYFRKKAAVKIVNKIADSKINEAVKTFPIETKKRIMLLSAILGFIFPGLPEVLWFRQKTKGILLILFTIFVWAAIVPFAFGAYWDRMGGIPGFSDLGKGLFDSARGIFTDARYYLFGGVISTILFTGVLIYFFVSAISAYRVARGLQQGMRPSKWSYTKTWLKTSGFPWLISIPGWILMLFIVISPVITSILISFTNYGFNHEAPGKTVDWVGLEQWGKWWIFRELNLGLSLSRVISWTIIWTIFSALIPIIVGIIVSVITNSARIKGKKIFRIIFIIPWAIPAFVTIIFLKSAFQADGGSLFNYIFLKLGIINEAINWFGSANIVKTLLILIQTWIGSAWIFMLVTGNLQSIPRDIYEAGSIDGAKNTKLFRFLTLPALLAAIAPMLITQFVGAFNNFTIISLFSGGNPQFLEPTIFGEGTTDIIISWVFKLASGAVKVDGDQAFAAALTTMAAGISIGVASYGFVKSMSRRD